MTTELVELADCPGCGGRDARVIGHRNYNSLQLYYQVSADDLADRL